MRIRRSADGVRIDDNAVLGKLPLCVPKRSAITKADPHFRHA